jgi:hypothetical protein
MFTEFGGATSVNSMKPLSMQQSNKAMFFKTTRTRPRGFYRFTALML